MDDRRYKIVGSRMFLNCQFSAVLENSNPKFQKPQFTNVVFLAVLGRHRLIQTSLPSSIGYLSSEDLTSDPFSKAPDNLIIMWTIF